MIRLFGHDWITSVEVAHSTLPLELPLPHYRGSGGSGTKDDAETSWRGFHLKMRYQTCLNYLKTQLLKCVHYFYVIIFIRISINLWLPRFSLPHTHYKTRIPMVFEGDLAQIAACHIKENDLVYITGQVSGEQSPLTTEQKQASIQVLFLVVKSSS